MSITKKRAAAFITMIVLLLTGAPYTGNLGAGVFAAETGGSAGRAFSDVLVSDWFFPYVEALADRGLTRGNPDGTYAPDGALLVDEFLAFALRTLGDDQENAPVYWAQNYVDRALETRLIDDGAYRRYDVPITREQIAGIVVRASGETFSAASLSQVRSVFTDIGQASDPDSVLRAIELGVLAGYEDRTFRPQNTATRAEAAAMVLRMIDKSYRLERYGNVFFNPVTDLNETGNIKKEKAFDFVMEAIKALHIDRGDDGKAVIRGDIPELPEGQIFVCNITFFSRTGKIVGFASTTSIIEGEIIPMPGKFELPNRADISDIGSIRIEMGIPTGTPPFYMTGSTAAFSIFKFYDNATPQTDNFIRHNDGGTQTTVNDFSLTEGIWGW